MSSGKRLWPQLRRLGSAVAPRKQPASICPFCSLAPTPRPTPRSQGAAFSRSHNTIAIPSKNPRIELENALLELQNHAPNLVNLPRLQLALQGLRQLPGNEIVRIALLDLDAKNGPGETTKRILRALVSDPLVDQESWETDLDGCDPSKPLIVRILSHTEQGVNLRTEREGPLNELVISSATLGGMNLEILVMGSATVAPSANLGAPAMDDAILNPPVDIPSTEDRFSPMSTPVHKTILTASGFSGAVKISGLILPSSISSDIVLGAANMEKTLAPQELDGAPFEVVDVAMAEKAIALFRKGPEHGMEFEKLWFASNMSTLAEWLKSDLDSANGTKPVVRNLISTLLQSSLDLVEAEDARKLSRNQAVKNLPEVGELNTALSQWAEAAHSELQAELDLAFTGRRWRKLGWWKLFWRVDDVAMLTNDMLSQRFLPTSERELVYLTGRIAGPKGEHPEYVQPKSAHETEHVEHTSSENSSGQVASSKASLSKWPGHISFTRRYLRNETIPALQALAQKLVLQSLGTSGMVTSITAFLYVSEFASTLYEAGGVAALGIVYSLGRMQKKWEAARSYWESDVREEGRKAVRGTEESIAAALSDKVSSLGMNGPGELQKTKDLVAKARDALARME